MEKTINSIKVINKEDLIGIKDYDYAYQIDVWIEDEIVFAYNNFIVEAHCSDAEDICVDYTVYNAETLNEIDGGQIDFNESDNDLQIIDLMQFTGIEGLENQAFDDVNWNNVTLLDHEDFSEKIN